MTIYISTYLRRQPYFSAQYHTKFTMGKSKKKNWAKLGAIDQILAPKTVSGPIEQAMEKLRKWIFIARSFELKAIC